MQTTKQLSDFLNVSTETVRGWSIEFARYLSPTATPSAGRHRRFTDNDMRVFTLIAELKNSGLLYEDIHAALTSGQRGDLPTPGALVIRSETGAQLAILEHRIRELETERETLAAQLTEAQTQKARLEGQLIAMNSVQDELKNLREELIHLHRENAKLEIRLENK